MHLQSNYEAISHLDGSLPVLGLGGDGEGGHGAALSGAVAVVHLDADEGGGGLGAVAAVDSELQHAEHEARHEAGPQPRHGVHGLHRQLAEERQHEVLQQMVLEDTDGGRLLPGLQGAAAELVLHGWAGLQGAAGCVGNWLI